MNKCHSSNEIAILIVEDHTLVSEAWISYLSSIPDFKIVGACQTAEDAFELINQLSPHVVIMDINLGGMNGIEATGIIRHKYPFAKVLGVSFHMHTIYVRKMMQQGASGYLTKNSEVTEMIDAIRKIHAGEIYICAELKDVLISESIHKDDTDAKLDLLSDREIEIIDYIKKGFYSREIAQKLDITVKTVNAHRYNILKKLKLKNTASLVQFININLDKNQNI